MSKYNFNRFNGGIIPISDLINRELDELGPLKPTRKNELCKILEESLNNVIQLEPETIRKYIDEMNPFFVSGSYGYLNFLMYEICNSFKIADDLNTNYIKKLLSEREFYISGKYVLILDNYIASLTQQARFRLEIFGEDTAKRYLENNLSRTLVYQFCNVHNKKMRDIGDEDEFRNDFDIDRNQIFRQICQTLGIGYSDPNNPTKFKSEDGRDI